MEVFTHVSHMDLKGFQEKDVCVPAFSLLTGENCGKLGPPQKSRLEKEHLRARAAKAKD